MSNHKQPDLPCTDNRRAIHRRMKTLLLAAILILIVAAISKTTQAQTFTVIHNFTGGQDGASPFTGLTITPDGTLYGTAFGGGSAGFGTVFSLEDSGSGWMLNPLYTITAGSDGAGPVGRLVKGPDGAFYGTTSAGGNGPCVSPNGYRGCGTVYKLRPPADVV